MLKILHIKYMTKMNGLKIFSKFSFVKGAFC